MSLRFQRKKDNKTCCNYDATTQQCGEKDWFNKSAADVPLKSFETFF